MGSNCQGSSYCAKIELIAEREREKAKKALCELHKLYDNVHSGGSGHLHIAYFGQPTLQTLQHIQFMFIENVKRQQMFEQL